MVNGDYTRLPFFLFRGAPFRVGAEKEDTLRKEKKNFSLSIRSIDLLIAVLTFIISVLLLLATYHAKKDYSAMRADTENYISWQRAAYDLQQASDYLTEQVRCFTQTGDREYMENYFEEADVTRRRDKALEATEEYLGETPVYAALLAAMDESMELMKREYYAMRLTAEAYGQDLSTFPEAVQAVELFPADAALDAAGKEALARSMVFDSIYHGEKERISHRVNECLDELVKKTDSEQTATADELAHILRLQRLLIILIIIIMLISMLLTLMLVISPLLRAVVYIRAEKPLPIKGSDEFQFLAKTYNLMYEANREQKEQLAYEATHDKLTGIYNRSGYDFFLKNTDLATSALLLFDADKFKQINDTYGHEMGDRVLKRAAKAIKQSFRSQDYVCRIGGDEFAVIMVHITNTNPDLIQKKVNRINQTLSKSDGDIPPIHLSCGAIYGDHTKDAEKFFRQADAALYRVKESGGNGCEVCGKN